MTSCTRRRALPARLAPFVGVLLLPLACDDMVVSVVDVAEVQVSPADATVDVRGSVRLDAQVFGNSGVQLSGRDVEWQSLHPDIATVEEDGTVIGVSPGDATIRATSEGASGTGTVRVRLGPSIALGATSIGFEAEEGGGNPAEQVVGVSNAGGGILSGLTASIQYVDGQPGNWLDADLASGTAPTHLVLNATTGSLAAGSYSATVRVSAGTAGNSPQSVQVTFDVAERELTVPGTPLSFTGYALSDEAILLTWLPPGGQTHYEIRRRRTGRNSDWDFSTEVSGSATSYLDDGLREETKYQYQIRACAGGACSDYSGILTIETDDD